MNRLSTPGRVALAGAVLLGSLSLVAWRQGKALGELETLENVRESIAIESVELAELAQRISVLDGVDRVREEAARRLGMRSAQEHELRIFGEEGR